MANNNLTGANLAGQKLANVDFRGATLTNANLSQTDLTNADFSVSYYYDGADLSGVDLTGADARGASFYLTILTGANTTNLIQPDGHLAGLDLTGVESLVVRDYDGNPAASPPTGPLPIVVEEHLTMDATGTLRLVFDADPWDSTISFALGIPVALGGSLELTFASPYRTHLRTFARERFFVNR